MLQQSDSMIEDRSLESGELGRTIKGAWRECLEESRIRKMSQEDAPQNIHITSSLSNAGTLKVSLSKAGIRQEAIVYSFEDFYAVGPLRHIDQSQYEIERYMWMTNHMGYDHYFVNGLHHILSMKPILESIPDHKIVTIWAGNNTHDYIFVRLVLHLLRGVRVEVQIINPAEEYERLPASDRIRTNEGNTDIVSLNQLTTEELAQILVQSSGNTLTEEERAQNADEWLDISSHSEMLRVLTEGKLHFLAEDAYDYLIMEVIHKQYINIHKIEDKYILHKEYVSAGLLIVPILERYPELMSVNLISYRFRSLIATKELDFLGVPNLTYQYYVKPAKV
ncbi:DUF1835 domain-containing protein [Paenibacillus sp. MER 78]|nr:DUF1835 domain-containing protein [Paenibacillus sp. MER 78]